MVRKLAVVAVVVAVTAFSGCKKDQAKEEGGGAQGGAAQGGAQAGQGGAAQGGAQAAAKNPEGCNSDLAQPIEADYAFTEKCSPYTVSGELYVDGWHLTIEPGVTVQVKDGGAIYVGYGKKGRITARGTAEKPIRFVAAGAKEPGAWRELRVYKLAEGSALENVVLEHAGSADTYALNVEAGDTTLKGVKIVGVRKHALRVVAEAPPRELSGLDLSEAGGDPDELVRLDFENAGALGAGNRFPEKSVLVLEGNCNRDMKLTAQGVPYRVQGEVYVEGSEGKTAILTVEAGTTLQMSEQAAMYFGYNGQTGSLKVQGTAEKPVTFTRYGEDAKATPWRGLTFYGGARPPELEYAVFEYAGRPDEQAIKFENARGLGKIVSCTFRHLAADAVSVSSSKDRFTAFDGNAFEDVSGAALELSLELANNLGKANKFAQGGFVRLNTGAKRDTTLTAIGVPYRLEGELYVESGDSGKTATLTVEPGVSFEGNDTTHLFVGYSNPGKLVAKGTADKPVTFGAVSGQKWKGLVAYNRASLELENAVFSAVADDKFPVEVQNEAKGAIKGLTFKDTKLGLKNCAGGVAASGVKADKGVKAETKCE